MRKFLAIEARFSALLKSSAAIWAALALYSCGSEEKRPELPPPPVAPPALAGGTSPAPPPIVIPADLKRDFGLADLSVAACVKRPEKGGPLEVENCSGAILYGPYTTVPEGATVAVSMTVEGVKGSALLGADIVSAAGARIHGWSRNRPLLAGDRGTIDFGAYLSRADESVEARLWSQQQDKPVAFRIVDARFEIRGP
jgi:hypothetical protein